MPYKKICNVKRQRIPNVLLAYIAKHKYICIISVEHLKLSLIFSFYKLCNLSVSCHEKRQLNEEIPQNQRYILFCWLWKKLNISERFKNMYIYLIFLQIIILELLLFNLFSQLLLTVCCEPRYHEEIWLLNQKALNKKSWL